MNCACLEEQTSKKLSITPMICGCDLEVMIRAFQALSPGSIPGVRTQKNIFLCRGSQAWPTAQDLRSRMSKIKGSMRHPVSQESEGSNPFPCISNSQQEKNHEFLSYTFLWLKKVILTLLLCKLMLESRNHYGIFSDRCEDD